MERLNFNGEMLSQIELEKLPYSSFDRSNHNYSSGKLGTLIPTRLDEVYPGDRIVGRPTAVVNFEPLAGPIMGTMVLKQESFYVPLFQLWKNATKFFTGKKGFSQPMPTVTPVRIFNLFEPYLLDIGDVVDSLRALQVNPDDEQAQEEFLNYSRNDINTKYQALYARAESFQMVDLFQPYFERIENDFIKVDSSTGFTQFDNYFYQYIGADVAERPAALEQLINLLTDFMQYSVEFFFGVSTLADYLGWPTTDIWPDYFVLVRRGMHRLTPTEIPLLGNLFSSLPLSWLPWRAAYLIWYWNYRDELLETECIDPEEDEFLGDTVTDDEIFQLYMLRYRCWYKDTYTTALTNTGDGNLIVPVGNSTVYGSTQIRYYNTEQMELQLENTSDVEAALRAGASVCEIAIGGVNYRVPMNYLQGTQDLLPGNQGISSASGFSLDMLDRIYRLRRFVQKKLIVGYEEDDVIWSNFLVRLSNVRMRIPEILSRGRDVVDMQTIVNNTNTAQQIAGDKTAVAWAKGVGSNVNYFSEEWGFYMSFLTVLPIQSYTGGMQRLWMKTRQFDWMWPDFATMGLDAVYNYELSAPRGSWSKNGLSDATALAVFGYQGRYYDLKTRQDETHGRMRTDLNYMTFSREWNEDNPPKQNYINVHCHPRTDMFVLDDPTMDLFRFDCFHDLSWRRRLPVPSEIIGY